MPGTITIRGLVKRYGPFVAVDAIGLDVPAGSFVSLLGPSGCGKTTTLRMLAGFIRPDEGEIRVDGTVISAPNVVLPPERRAMGMVFQSYAVWPHMTVFDNVAYGLRYGPGRRPDAAALKTRVDEMIELVGLAGQQKKLPSQLSGGQQQRVALARALVTEPQILLLDEPLSNLDAKLRESMRFELRRLQRRLGITAVFVTHSQEEALLLSDRIAVMRRGRIVEYAPPEALYRSPETRFVADFVGLSNFIEGRIVGRDGSHVLVDTPLGRIRSRGLPDAAAGGAAEILVRPESITIAPAGSHTATAGENVLPGTIREVLFNGAIVDYLVACGPDGATMLRAQRFAPRAFAEGDAVEIAFAAEEATQVRPD